MIGRLQGWGTTGEATEGAEGAPVTRAELQAILASERRRTLLNSVLWSFAWAIMAYWARKAFFKRGWR